MNTIKETFFDKGFISPIKALDVSTATEIKNKYVNFYENISSTREKVEHKSKSAQEISYRSIFVMLRAIPLHLITCL